MAQFIGIQEVKNYDHWKKSFDEDNSTREKAGIKTVSVTRGFSNPNEVCVVMETKDPEAAEKFANSPELKKIMEESGVLPGGKLFIGKN